MKDFYADELSTDVRVKTEYSITITHKATGKKVSGKGPHKYKLECELLEELRGKLK